LVISHTEAQRITVSVSGEPCTVASVACGTKPVCHILFCKGISDNLALAAPGHHAIATKPNATERMLLLGIERFAWGCWRWWLGVVPLDVLRLGATLSNARPFTTASTIPLALNGVSEGRPRRLRNRICFHERKVIDL
jgi:hypothetical protein